MCSRVFVVGIAATDEDQVKKALAVVDELYGEPGAYKYAVQC